MDDNVVVFATTNERFFNYNNIFYHMNKKHGPHMANFAISIGLLSHGSSFQLSMGLP
jgi:hypothetical protein